MNNSWEALGALVALVTLLLQILISWPQIRRRTAGLKTYRFAIQFFFFVFSFFLLGFWLNSRTQGLWPGSEETNSKFTQWYANFSNWAINNRTREMIIGGIWLLGGIFAVALIADSFKQGEKEAPPENTWEKIGFRIFIIFLFGLPGLALCYFGWRFFVGDIIAR